MRSPFYLNLLVKEIKDFKKISDIDGFRNLIWNDIMCMSGKTFPQGITHSAVREAIEKIVFNRAEKFLPGVRKEEIGEEIVNILQSENIITTFGGFIMSDKRAPRRSLDDWMELVTECRQSGLTDAAWCEAQGISPSCFYNAVSRLRKRACQIPDPIGKASTLNLTSHKQDVVQIAIEPELSPAELFQDERSSSMYLDNSHTIEIEAKGLTIRMSNTVQPMLLKILMDALKEPLC